MLTPFADGRHTLKIGLQPLDPADWIAPDSRLGEVLALKARLHEERPAEVFAALPGSEAAQCEVLALLAAHLPERFPALYLRAGDRLHVRASGTDVPLGADRRPPLQRAGLLVQEDLCLMDRSGAAYALVAASLCSPAAWRLREKLGRPLTDIHAPVPGYASDLAPRVDRIFAHLKTDMPVWRTNWSLPASPDFFLPDGHGPDGPDLTPADVGRRVHLRAERQTLRRLPQTGAILFTIKTEITRLADVAADPSLAGALARAVRAMPEALAAYKAILPFRAVLLAFLDRAAGEVSPAPEATP